MRLQVEVRVNQKGTCPVGGRYREVKFLRTYQERFGGGFRGLDRLRQCPLRDRHPFFQFLKPPGLPLYAENPGAQVALIGITGFTH